MLVSVYCLRNKVEEAVDARKDFRLAHRLARLVPVADDAHEPLFALPDRHQRLPGVALTRRRADSATAQDSLGVFREVAQEEVLAFLERQNLVTSPVRGNRGWSC